MLESDGDKIIALMTGAISALFSVFIWLLKATIEDLRDQLRRERELREETNQTVVRAIEIMNIGMQAMSAANEKSARQSEESHRDILSELRGLPRRPPQ